MTGFVSVPPNVDADPPEPAAPDVVSGDGFWPDIDLGDLRAAIRLDTTIPRERLIDAVRVAMLDLARELADWRATNAGAAANLQAVPARILIGGVSDYVIYYGRALYSLVGADLGERLLEQSVTSAGVDRREALTAEVDQHRRNARWAINDFAGKRRVTVDLI